MIQLIVNGKPHELREQGTVGELLRELGAAPDRVALMVNDRIARRASWNKVRLQNGDRLEVLTFAGGG
jgi:sulfur carrier protein